MQINEIGAVLKVDLVNNTKKYLEIGDHIEVIVKGFLTRQSDKKGLAGVLTRVEPVAIRITDYTGKDYSIDLEDIEEIINE